MKRGIAFVLGLFLLSFVSAQFFDGGYGSFSISDFFDSINSQDITILAFFLIIFAFLFLILTRIGLFKDAYGQPNKGIVGVISFAISLLSVYGIYKTGFSIENLFSGFGISTDLFSILIWIILGIAALFLIWKLKFKGFFMIFGLLLILIAVLTNLFYEKGIAFIIGSIMFVIGLLLWWRGRKKKFNPGRGDQNQPPEVIERERIVYQQRQRSLYDLKQKLYAYKFQYNNARGNPQRQKRIGQAMNIIEREIRRLGG